MFKIGSFTFLFCFISIVSFGQTFSGAPSFTDPTVCDGESAEVTVVYLLSPTGAAITLAWDDGVTTVVTTTASAGNNSATAGVFTASTQVLGNAVICKLEISDATGLNAKAYEATVVETTAAGPPGVTSGVSDALTVSGNPSLTAVLDQSTCEGMDIDFGTTVSGGSGSYDVIWTRYTGATTDQFDDEVGAVVGTLTGTLMDATTGMTNSNIGVEVTDANGCKAATNPASTTLTVSQAPSITTQPAANSEICSGDEVTLIVEATNATTYDWSSGGSNSSETVSAAGSYTVVVGNAECTAGLGAVTSDLAVVAVKPVLAITTQPTSPGAGQGENGTASLTATAAGGRSIAWTLGGEALSGAMTAAGTGITVNAEVDNGGDSYTYSVDFTNVAAGDVGKLIAATVTDECTSVNSATAPLPVEYTFFKASLENNEVLLDWETASEINNEAFFIEKSNDGLSFEEMGIVEGAGNSFEPIQYRFVDATPNAGTNYYRLRQMDFDGTTDLSEVVSVEIEKDGAENNSRSFNVNINPTSALSEVQIALDNTFEQDISVQIFDAMGRNILNSTIAAGSQFLHVDVSVLPESQYFVKINNQNEVVTKSFFKL